MRRMVPQVLGSYLKDRVALIFTYYVGILLTVILSWLDILGQGLGFMKLGNLIYLLILSTFILGLGLAYDFVRQRRFLMTMYHMNNESNPDLQEIIGMASGTTEEQKWTHGALHHQYRAYMDQLNTLQLSQEQQYHFTNQWVHHMKTPVSVIDLHIQETKNSEQLEETKSALTSIQEENERIRLGLEMMLHTARLDKFEFDLHVQRIDLIALVRQVINEHKKACIHGGIFPKVECDEPLIEIETDEKWMRFILNQLIINAIKYSKLKPGTKQLTIRAERAEDGAETIIQVIDTGIGIAAHDLPRVIEPFFTGENGRKGPESTGMGLFLVHQVIQKLGAQIAFESVEGEGTTVTLRFRSTGIYHEVLKKPVFQ